MPKESVETRGSAREQGQHRSSAREAARKLIHDVRRDAQRYQDLRGARRNLGFWATLSHRIGVFAQQLPPPLRGIVLWPQRKSDAFFRMLFNIHISSHAKIGPGLLLIHPWCVLIGACEIGENCLIFHEVTLGTNANSDGAFPSLGNDVDIYVGARVLGKLHVGDGAKIGANCVVLNSVPAGSVVAPPATRPVSAAAAAVFGPRAKSEPP
jgi:serine O-acetyltransferase